MIPEIDMKNVSSWNVLINLCLPKKFSAGDLHHIKTARTHMKMNYETGMMTK